MAQKLSIGIILASNGMNGIAKLSAMMADDLAMAGHTATIFVPIMPYYYYFVTVGRKPLHWIKNTLPYVSRWVKNRKFSFQDMLDHNYVLGSASVKFVLTSASRKQLQSLDYLIVNGIGDVLMYKDKFPQERQIYIVNQLEERSHNNPRYITDRQSFKGKFVAISEFMAETLSLQIKVPPIVPNPISKNIWDQRGKFDINGQRRDIVFYWKNNVIGRIGGEILKALLEIRPDTSVTVWFRSGMDTTKPMIETIIPGVDYVYDLRESQVSALLLSHSLMLFPQTFEEFGMPPVEGLACGCIPILHENVGAASMYARGGENCVFLHADPSISATRIQQVLDNSDILHKLRLYASESIEAFNPDRYGLRILEAAEFL